MRIFALLFVLLLAVSVSAEFAAFGNPALSLQPCSTDVQNVTIQNTGAQPTAYELSVDGDGADFVTFGALLFTLESGQAVNIPVFYNIPCTTEPDVYPLSIYFSDGETELELFQEISVALSETLNASTTATSIVTAPCQKSVFNFTLHNPSNFTELYSIDASGRSDLALSEEQTVLTSGQRKTIKLTIEPEDCTEHGTYPLSVAFESEKSEHSQTFDLEYIITPTDIPELAEGTSRIKTDYVDSTTDLTIKNLGDRTTAYSLSLDGIKWGSISPSKITLAPGEVRKVTLRLVPPADTPSDSYQVSLNARVDQTGITYNKEFVIVLAIPGLRETNPAAFWGIVAAIIIVLVLLFFLIRYSRSEKFKRKYSVWKQKRAAAREKRAKARAAKRAEHEKRRENRLQERLMRRKKYEEQQKKLREQALQRAEKELKREYKLVSHKEITRGAPVKTGSWRAFVWILFIAIVALLAIGLWDYLAPNLPFVIVGLAVVALLIIYTWIRRASSTRRRYKLLLPEQTVTIPVWKRGLSQLAISTAQATRNFIVHVAKTKTRVKPSPFVYQTFQLRENADAETLATFTIPKRLLERNGIELDSLRIARYTNHAWKTVSYEKTGEDKNSLFLRAELAPGTHCIYLKNVKTKPRKWPAAILGVAGLVLLALVVASLYEPIVTGVIPPQTWKKDTVHQVDLSPFFKDPDNDTLTFSATKAANIAIDIVGTKATFTPKTGWTGQEQVKFTADDKRGGKIQSNPVMLTVREQIVPPPVRIGILVLIGLVGLWFVVYAFRKLRK